MRCPNTYCNSKCFCAVSEPDNYRIIGIKCTICNGMGTRFPSALIGINVPPPQGIEGKILFTKLNEVKPNSSYD
jgi:hypothetical protein